MGLLDRLFGAQTFSMSPADPAMVEWLRINGMSPSSVDESSVMGLTAVYRSQAIIAGTIATLPLRVYEGTKSNRTEVDSWLSDAPAGPYDLSAFSWMETLVLHLLNHGEAFLKTLTNGGGQRIGAWLVHPLALKKVTWIGPLKHFEVSMQDGSTQEFDTGEMNQILGMSTDGTRGLSPLTLLRTAFQTSMAGEHAAGRTFSKGALIAGVVTTAEGEDVTEDEGKTIKQSLNDKIMGADHAGEIAFVNRALKFTPWTMTNEDAQFIESRAMQVEEVARIYGLPINLLSVNGAVSNWGTGVAEANLGLQKYVLMPWTSRIESAIKPMLEPGQFAEFDYAGLLQGTPKDEITLLIEQVGAGLMTVDEARAVRNLPPLPKVKAPAFAPVEPAAVGSTNGSQKETVHVV